MDPVQELRDALAKTLDEQNKLVDTITTENRGFNDDEKADYDRLEAEYADTEARLDVAAKAAERKAKVDEARSVSPVVTVTHEPLTYEPGNGRSYFADLAGRAVGNHDAATRLARHATEMEVEVPKRDARRAARAAKQLEERFGEGAGFERRVNPSRVTGQGGELVPPLWLEDQLVPYLRAGRVTVDLSRKFDLPEGTDSINLPKLASGTSTAVQTDNSGVSSTDLTTTSVQANVRTIAGQQDVALQLIEQSPVNFDEIVFTDLKADYDRTLDTQGLSGTGVGGLNGGQLLGYDNVSGINTVTYTDASPTLGKMYVPVGQAASLIARQRFLPPQALVMHPRRWWWGLTQLDSQNRPLVVPSVIDNYNALAIQDGVPVQGPAGNIAGMPVYLDANVTTTDGAGTNQDRIYALRPDDTFLWEGSLRMRAIPEVLSGTLQVRLQIYNYVAFMPHRLPVANSIVVGTGLVGPSGF